MPQDSDQRLGYSYWVGLLSGSAVAAALITVFGDDVGRWASNILGRYSLWLKVPVTLALGILLATSFVYLYRKFKRPFSVFASSLVAVTLIGFMAVMIVTHVSQQGNAIILVANFVDPENTY